MLTGKGTAMASAVLALGLALPASAWALPSSAPDQAAFEANGEVKAVARGNGVTYLGGNFTELRARTGGFAALSPATGMRDGSFPQLEGLGGGGGTVKAIAADGAGGFYIGGFFTSVGGVPRNNIAHVLADGTVDPAFNPDADNSVDALAVSGPAVYAGGSFTTIGGQSRTAIAKLSASNGNASSTFNANAAGVVTIVDEIAVSGSALFVGGSFDTIGGQSRDHIAKISATSGNAFSAWNPGANGTPFALAVSGGTVYAGGTFNGPNSLGGQDRNHIARLSAATGNVSSWNPNADGPVFAVAVANSQVYAGGSFTAIGGRARDNIAKLSATTGIAFQSWNPDADAAVFGLAVSGTNVYVAGDFTAIGGLPRSRIAKLSATSGNAFSAFNPNAGGPGSPTAFAVAVSGSKVGAGGQFTTMNGVTRNRIAALDANGRPTAFNPNANGIVHALAAAGTEVYAGGDFTVIGGRPRNHIAKLSATSGNAFSAWDPDATGGVMPHVRALQVTGGAVYAGGSFTDIGGQARDNIAKLSTTSGNAFSAWNPAADDAVFALAVSDGAVYAGGAFANIGGEARNRIAKLSATSGNAFSAFNPGADGLVFALAVSDSAVYAGGDFLNIGGQVRNRIAKLSATSGNAFFAWDPVADGPVAALASRGSAIYAGGSFTTIDGQARNRIAALSATSGDAFFSFNPNMDAFVNALEADSSGLYVGGDFSAVGGRPRRGYAQFSGP